jgi:hypothetical protein
MAKKPVCCCFQNYMVQFPKEHDMPTTYCDGHYKSRNPGGDACYGLLALDNDELLLAQDYGCVARGAGATNNASEYSALTVGKLLIAPLPGAILEVER